MNVGIVGLGLIGGSMAKSIKIRTAHTVWGTDLDSETMIFARLAGAIDGTLTRENLPQCDLILVAIRPAAAVEWVREHALQIGERGPVWTLRSERRSARRLRLLRTNTALPISAAPDAGRERGGFLNASENLFNGASMILTPDAHTDMRMLEDAQVVLYGYRLCRADVFPRRTSTTA
jgi:prephenate dehydrogenase